MTQSLAFARYYEAVRDACAQPKLAANWLMGEVSRRLNADGLDIEASPVHSDALAALIRRVADGTLSNNGARQVFDALWAAAQVGDVGLATERNETLALAAARVDQQIDKLGLKKMSDAGALEALVDEVIAANAKSVEEYRAGKDKAFNALVGQVMKASKGKANPAQANQLLKKKLG
jgi:aspartyl-tRNA(Asn)/glutamyl-tRNA(Gln) amidotransferase subunit B